MITKAIVHKLDRDANRCLVRVPLFETASNPNPVVLTAYPSIVPGLFNNLYIGDIVYVGFEENALEKPIILGKFYKNAKTENKAKGGAGNFNTLNVLAKASVPSSTRFRYTDALEASYEDFNTPKKLADRIKENIEAIKYLNLYTQPWNMRVDDGDLDLLDGINIDQLEEVDNSELILDTPPDLTVPPKAPANTIKSFIKIRNGRFRYKIK